MLSLCLLLIPSLSSLAAVSEAGIGALLVLLTGLGLLTDVPVGAAVDKYGPKRVILLGALLFLLGSLCLKLDATVWILTVSAACLGVATSLVINPVLGVLSATAESSQGRTQFFNVVLQRGGALMAVLMLLGQSDTAVFSQGVTGAVVISCVMLICALMLPNGSPSATVILDDLKPIRSWRETSRVQAFVKAYELARNSPDVAMGSLGNAMVPALLIFGGSFFPLKLWLDGSMDALVPALALREIVAVASALLAVAFHKRIGLRLLMNGSMLVSAASIAGLVFITNTTLLIVAFAMHGVGIGVGVWVGNMHMYKGTSIIDRVRGYTVSSIANRIAGILLPVGFAWAWGFSHSTLLLAVSATLCVLLLFYNFSGRRLKTARVGYE